MPHLSVAENIFLNREPRLVTSDRHGGLRHDAATGQGNPGRLGRRHSGARLIKQLPVAAQQMVEIAKAFSLNASMILMDEPTSALSSREVDALFAVMRRLRDKGVSVVFISHRLEEIRQVVDRVIVMRDGHRVGNLPIAEATEKNIIRLMVGREVGLFPKEEAQIGEPILEVRNISGKNGVRNVSFTVRKGEILGLAGLVGAGRTEVARLICGVDCLTSGEISH